VTIKQALHPISELLGALGDWLGWIRLSGVGKFCWGMKGSLS